jgi:esterase/lipase
MKSLRSSLFLLLIFAPLITGAIDEQRQSQWLLEPKSACREALILVHGLNLKPSAMDEIGLAISQKNLPVYRLALPGHRGESEEQRLKIKVSDLTDSLASATKMLRSRCSGPIYSLGFSLGGLLTVVAQGEGLVSFDKMILIAPALSLKSYTHLVTWLFPFFDIIPSRGPVNYRASKDGTSEALYRALFTLHDRVQGINTKLLERPTYVYLNKDDELVSWSGTADFIIEKNLEVNWSLSSLDNDQAKLKSFDHLVIDEKTISPRSWEKLLRDARHLLEIRNPKSP